MIRADLTRRRRPIPEDTVRIVRRRLGDSTLIVADADGRVFGRFEGYGGKERLVRFLQDSLVKARAR